MQENNTITLLFRTTGNKKRKESRNKRNFALFIYKETTFIYKENNSQKLMFLHLLHTRHHYL